MDFRKLVEQRVSVRTFRPDPVPLADVREMVRVAGLAPSPNNSQPWQFVAVSRPALLKEMAEAVQAKVLAMLPEPAGKDARNARQRVAWFSTFFAEAPLVVAVLSFPYESEAERAIEGPAPSGAQINAMRGQPDILCLGAAVEHLLLAAADMGYGGCWLSGPLVARDALERLLGVSAPARLATMVAIGKPAADHAAEHERKPVDEILRVVG